MLGSCGQYEQRVWSDLYLTYFNEISLTSFVFPMFKFLYANMRINTSCEIGEIVSQSVFWIDSINT